MSEERVRQLMHQLATAIYYMHAHGIAHRDLKPENIIMTDNSDKAELRVIDFGISAILAPGENSTDSYGTIAYVAPEVLMGKPYDKEVDLWSIGVITYMLLSGSLPFNSPENSNNEIAQLIVNEKVKFELPEFATVSGEAIQIISKLMTKRPAQRLTIDGLLSSKWLCADGMALISSRKNGARINKFAAMTSVKCEVNYMY